MFDFRGRGKEVERERKRNIDQSPPAHSLTRDQTHNLGACPDQGWNPKTSGVWDNAPTN